MVLSSFRGCLMNYSYDNSRNNEIIKEYNIVDDEIIVTFLDGSSVEIDYSYLEKIKKLMYKQALEREQMTDKSELAYNKKKSFDWMLAQLSLTTLYTSSFLITDSIVAKTLAIFLTGTSSILTISDGLEYKSLRKELNELEKYSLFLKMNKEDQKKIGIDRLDNLSLKDARKLVKKDIKN